MRYFKSEKKIHFFETMIFRLLAVHFRDIKVQYMHLFTEGHK